jgi:two-component system sensor histidine kinase/response regulator
MTLVVPQILLVDDDQALLDALPETLKLRLPDVRVDVCESGPTAVERLQVTVYHAIISDMTMPGMGGLEFLGAVRRQCPFSPVVFMTGRTESALVSQALRAGAYDFLHKPIDRDQFVLSVKRALEVYSLRAYCDNQDLLVTQVAQQLRQLQLILRPLLLSNLRALGKELGDERIEQTRGLIETSVDTCRRQCALIARRLEFIEKALHGTKERLESLWSQVGHRTDPD